MGRGDLRAVNAQAVSNVVENGLGERVGALENHADAATIGSDVLREDVLTVEQNFAFEAGAAHGLVHAGESAEQRGLAAAGKADERGDLICGDAHADVEKDLLGAVKKND